MSIITITGLSVRRRTVPILKEICWQVDPGEHWVVLGANGSGKTSLLNCVTGYLTPTAGEVNVLGRTYGRSDWRELRKLVGLVSSSIRHWIEDQQLALDVVASGREAALNSWAKAEGTLKREALHAMRQVEASHLANRPWVHLSQGERQRILIGRALMARYQLLILDEPCAGLDPVAREHFLDFVRRLATAPKTPSLILVTHHIEEILPCFNRALLLRAGRVAASGTIDQVIRSEALSEAFDAPLEVARGADGRFELMLGRSPL
jgi:iron complex transport system ATP-binding protein